MFGDCQIAEKILKTKDPRKIKSLGRKVKGFTDEVWDDNCLQIVRLGNVCKVRYLILRTEVFPNWPRGYKLEYSLELKMFKIASFKVICTDSTEILFSQIQLKSFFKTRVCWFELSLAKTKFFH